MIELHNINMSFEDIIVYAYGLYCSGYICIKNI